MPYKEEKKVEKLYYSIGEVAKILNVNASLIRFWEKEFNGFINPKKNKKGNRFFTRKDIENLQLIYHLVKEKGMTLNGAKNLIKEKKSKVSANYEVIKTLQEIKNILLEIHDIL